MTPPNGADTGSSPCFHAPVVELRAPCPDSDRSMTHRVLVVDDDADVTQLLSYNFRDAGYDVLSANDGMTAVSLAHRWLPETIAQLHAQGALAVASHPHVFKSEWGKNTLYLWENQDEFAPLLDAWEIANRNDIFAPVALLQAVNE